MAELLYLKTEKDEKRRETFSRTLFFQFFCFSLTNPFVISPWNLCNPISNLPKSSKPISIQQISTFPFSFFPPFLSFHFWRKSNFFFQVLIYGFGFNMTSSNITIFSFYLFQCFFEDVTQNQIYNLINILRGLYSFSGEIHDS